MLEKIVRRESTNFQWGKLGMNYGMLTIMIVSQVVRGPGSGEKSVVGIEFCHTTSWITFAILVVCSVSMTLFSIRLSAEENEEKLEAGYTFTKGD